MEITDPSVGAPVEQAPDENTISWTAHEYISHEKPTGWYIGFALITVVTSVLVYVLSGGGFSGFLSSMVVVVMSAALFVYAKRPPRDLDYALEPGQFSIGEKVYSYSDYRSFAVVNTEGILYIRLDPLHRFGMALTFYFDPNDGEQILNFLASRLPNVEREPDFIDKITHKLRL